MSKFRPRRPSPAFVVAVIALFASLGGTSYAALSLTKNSVGTKQLKNGSVTSTKIQNGAVTTSKIQNGAVTASKLNVTGVTVPNALHANTANTAGSATNAGHASSADNATNAANAAALGGQSPSAYQSTGNLMFASVSTSATGATVVRGRGATGAGRISTGNYFVSFNQPILGCTWIATYGVNDTTGSVPYFVTVEGRSISNPTDVEVRERDATTAGAPPVDGQGFHIEVLCP